MISAANTPGIQPNKVKIKVMINDPHPLSRTARGGNKIARITRNKLIVLLFGYLFVANTCRMLHKV